MAAEKAVMLVPYNQELGGEPKEITAEILQRLHRLESQVLHHASEVPAWRPPTAIDSHGSSARLLAQANGASVDTDSVQPKVSSLANPASLGLFAFAFTTALLQGATTTLTETNVEKLTYCYALAYGGLVQLLAGMWEIPRGNVFGAVAFSSYGGFWIGFGLFGILSNAGILNGADPGGVEMMLSLWGCFTFMMFVQTFAMNVCLQLLFSFLTVTFGLLAGGVRNHTINKVAGVFGLITAAIAFYTAFAELTNEVYKRKVIPMGVYKKTGRGPLLPVQVRSNQ